MLHESLSTDFGQVAAAIDDAERIGGERIGGPVADDTVNVRRLEGQLPAPAEGTDWQWLARRLARALENGWHGRPAALLIRLAK
jgi:hypothetical protein